MMLVDKIVVKKTDNLLQIIIDTYASISCNGIIEDCITFRLCI